MNFRLNAVFAILALLSTTVNAAPFLLDTILAMVVGEMNIVREHLQILLATILQLRFNSLSTMLSILVQHLYRIFRYLLYLFLQTIGI